MKTTTIKITANPLYPTGEQYEISEGVFAEGALIPSRFWSTPAGPVRVPSLVNSTGHIVGEFHPGNDRHSSQSFLYVGMTGGEG